MTGGGDHDAVAPEHVLAGRRLTADPQSVEKGLASLVLTVIELVRQLMERQAIRRIDEGDLTSDQIERVGLTMMKLEEAMAELRDHFGLTADDLNIDLGPLGPLLPRGLHGFSPTPTPG
jgi:Gas vesicle protein K